ncbi:hypothetical protein F751_2802 [Auxenochlorella protothecoides]|uniref:Uncharacterized protein n=1 Tax=Auxenochlorella protothecoides TaxID=3075 RepID=A0A087SQ07_AUXPR|nr:hypothetical protein F751_2802 [Auxenochlorella protothecoides]KFM27811.1 hypothetical protein F751_2802 [Auxenochlorella protothecoides]
MVTEEGGEATSFAVQQEDETWELPPFLNHVDKPMLEMQANSNVWYQAHILNHSTTELYVLFPASAPGLQKEERALEARSAQQDELLLAWFKHHYELLGRAGLLKGAQLKGNAEVGPLPRHVRVSLLHTGKTATSPAIASPPATDEGAGAKKGRVRGVRAELRSLGLWNWQRGGASSSSEGPSDDDGGEFDGEPSLSRRRPVPV